MITLAKLDLKALSYALHLIKENSIENGKAGMLGIILQDCSLILADYKYIIAELIVDCHVHLQH